MDGSVSVVGLGKLGACMAAAMASRGIPTVGVDVNATAVQKVERKLSPLFEPGLAEMMASCDGLLCATTDVETAVRRTDITFVVVPTPSNAQGAFSLEYVRGAMQVVGRTIREKPDYHLVVLTSTVLPGSTEYFVKPLLEKESGKRSGTEFGLCYNPEFIALGSVLQDFLNPDFLLIGECDSRAGEKLAAFYRDKLRIQAVSAHMTPINAELTKIALNTFVTTKITFANVLAEICEQLPGGDVDAVTNALGLDQRVGSKYLKGALGYGGPCFPRDNAAFAHLLEAMEVTAELPRTVDRINRMQPARIASMIERLEQHNPQRAAVLGLAYKPNTNVVEDSQGIAIARLLAEKGFAVSVFDPAAMETGKIALGDAVRYAGSAADCISGAEVIVLATDWPEFRSIPYQLANSKPRPVIVDGWRMLQASYAPGAFSYRGVGIGYPRSDARERLERFVESLVQPITAPQEKVQPLGSKAAAQ